MKSPFYYTALIAAAGYLLSQPLSAQNGAELAFSRSYSFEYDEQYAKAIESILPLSPESYEVSLRLGWLYYLNKDYIKSETYYKKAIATEPSSVEARFGIVLPLAALGNWNQVLTQYLDVLRIDPNNSIANYRLGYIYFSRKDYVNTMVYLNKVIRLYPFDYDSNLLAGKVLILQGKPAEAKKHLLRALEYNPESEEAKAALKRL